MSQYSQEARRKHLADEYELSYGRLNIVRELGYGQFGKVYLANLAGVDPEDNLVAVKMSSENFNSMEGQIGRVSIFHFTSSYIS